MLTCSYTNLLFIWNRLDVGSFWLACTTRSSRPRLAFFSNFLKRCSALRAENLVQPSEGCGSWDLCFLGQYRSDCVAFHATDRRLYCHEGDSTLRLRYLQAVGKHPPRILVPSSRKRIHRRFQARPRIAKKSVAGKFKGPELSSLMGN